MCVFPVLRYQLGMTARFDNGFSAQQINPIDIANCRQPVGNDDGSPALHQLFQRTLYQLFTFIIQRTGRFVQNQNLRILQKQPCNTDPLPLSARQGDPLCADQRIISHWKSTDISVNSSLHSSPFDLRVRCSGTAETDIVANGPVKNDNFLLNNSDIFPQSPVGQLPQIHSVQCDSPASHIIKPRSQHADGRLANAGRASECH